MIDKILENIEKESGKEVMDTVSEIMEIVDCSYCAEPGSIIEIAKVINKFKTKIQEQSQ